ncbi:MAG: hypothetical protein EA356_12425 [Geminicoccaceae bacterium]|nr:MAG: hypothetical protein EA356_12425 [Geminicoccaceae bacterium]
MAQVFTAERSFVGRPLAARSAAGSGRSLADLLREQDQPAAAAAGVEGEVETPGPAAPPPPAPATFSEADVDARVRAARDEARLAALAEAAQAHDRAIERTLETIAANLARAREAQHQDRQADMRRVTALVAAITRQVVPQAAAWFPLDDLTTSLEAICTRLEAQDQVRIDLNPDLVEPVRAHMATLAAREAAGSGWELRADPALQPGDAIVHWPSGQAEHRLDRLVDEALALCSSWLEQKSVNPAAPTTVDVTDAIERTDP